MSENGKEPLNELRERLIMSVLPKRPPADRLLHELDDLLRTAPAHAGIVDEAALAWRGRTNAVLASCGSAFQVRSQVAIAGLGLRTAAPRSFDELIALIHEARHSLMLEEPASTTVAVLEKNSPFEYFDALRALLETARSDVLFVDPFIDVDFLGRYLPQLRPEVKARLLIRNYAAKVVPAAEMYTLEMPRLLEVRASKSFHDRFVFIDGRKCFQSGASFKDGGKFAPTTITEIVDGFHALASLYESLWSDSERLFEFIGGTG